ncbi:MAG: glycosyltransferase [Kiritimatiellae bacterium]|nr:glycosyltransferase [Kiritimatiellia bacterium]MBQ6142481.1 glycosyltransferase [Kiritimatiellia bacterium]
MKISLITACYNSAGTIRIAIESVLSQKGVDVEYIVVDGGSSDGTVEQIENVKWKMENGCGRFTFKFISERDRGMYDAINKGIKMATGDIVGILNADDVLATDDTLAHIASAFEPLEVGSRQSQVDCAYADIRFVKEGATVESLRTAPTVRYCSARRWRPWMFRFAAMVPHPSFYARRECFDRLGGYSLDYRICADFELELRYLYLAKLRAAYLPECVVVMRMGGVSTAGWRSNVEINCEDLRALRAHGIWSCLPLIYLKYLFKIWGFVFRRGKR